MADAKFRRVLVVLNKRAGSLLDRDVNEVRTLALEALGPMAPQVDVILTHGRGLPRAVDRAVAEHYDALIVGGGDGTVNYAARRLARTDLTIGVVPLGTLNLLARDLRMPSTLEEALAALPKSTVRPIDLARVNGRLFHTLSGVGFFSQMARAREETRHLPGRMIRFGAAFMRAIGRTGRLTLTIHADDIEREVDVFAVLVTNNLLDRAGRQRPRLDDGLLEVHLAEERGVLARIKAGSDVLTGAWRGNPGIHSFTARRVRIESARRRTWMSNDGELLREPMPLEYSIERQALQLLVPPDGQDVVVDAADVAGSQAVG